MIPLEFQGEILRNALKTLFLTCKIPYIPEVDCPKDLKLRFCTNKKITLISSSLKLAILYFLFED